MYMSMRGGGRMVRILRLLINVCYVGSGSEAGSEAEKEGKRSRLG